MLLERLCLLPLVEETGSFFNFAKKEIELVKKDLHCKVMENSCLWQSTENKLSMTVYISLFRSFVRELLTC